MSRYLKVPLGFVIKPLVIGSADVNNKSTRRGGAADVNNRSTRPGEAAQKSDTKRTEMNKKLYVLTSFIRQLIVKGNINCKLQATQLVESYLELSQVPGVSVAVSVNGSVVYKKGFGYQDLRNRVKCTGDMMGNIASITKLYLAYFTLRTIQDFPEFDISKPIGRYLPEIICPKESKEDSVVVMGSENQKKLNQIRIMHLLTHTSGVRHHVNGLNYKVECPDMYTSFGYVLDDDLKMNPGEGFVYTSIGCQMLAAVLEVVHDRDFRDFSTDELLLLNLKNTHFSRTQDLYLNRYSGYKVTRGGLLKCGDFCDYSWFNASEGIVTNVEDLVKFGNIMFLFAASDDYQGLLEKYWAQKMFTIYVRNTQLPSLKYYNDSGVGLLWNIGIRDGKILENGKESGKVRHFFHNGSSRTGTSTLLLRWEDNGDVAMADDDDKLQKFENYQEPDVEMVYQNNPSTMKRAYEKHGKLVTVAVIANGQMYDVEEIAKNLGDIFAKNYIDVKL